MKVTLICQNCEKEMTLTINLKDKNREERYIKTFVKSQKCPTCGSRLSIKEN